MVTHPVESMLNPFIATAPTGFTPSQMPRAKRIKEDSITPLKGFKFGCDPELFILDQKGEPVCAEGLIPGTKSDPYPVLGGAVQVDGMAAEFNIEPADNYASFQGRVRTVMTELFKMLPKGYTFSDKPVVTFSEKVWEEAPDKAKELGCTPDFNAWTGLPNPPPNDPENPRMRTASGHIHLGWTEGESIADLQHLMNCQDIVKQLDWYLGAWSTTVDPYIERRRLYGKAGACRYKDYGVEYRVLSNFWLFNDNILPVWNRLQRGILDMRDGFLPEASGYSPWNGRVIKAVEEGLTNDETLTNNFQFPLLSLRG